MGLRLILLLACGLLLAGCEADATPIAAVLPPTPTAIQPPPTLPPPLRYALADNVAGYLPPADLQALQASGLVEQLADGGTDADLTAGYDVVMRFGDVPTDSIDTQDAAITDWTRSPSYPHVLLIINRNLPPLDNPRVVDVLRNALDGIGLVDTLGILGAEALLGQEVNTVRLRNELADLGYPDGFLLTLAHTRLPGVAAVQGQLAASNFDTRLLSIQQGAVGDTLAQNRAHLLLASWSRPEQRAEWAAQISESDLLDLYSLPIRYRAVPDVSVQFTPGGWPLASR